MQVPGLRTILPLDPTGLETEFDEMFKLTTKDGKLAVKKFDREEDDNYDSG